LAAHRDVAAHTLHRLNRARHTEKGHGTALVLRLQVIYRVYENEVAFHSQNVSAHNLPVVACPFETEGLALDLSLLAVAAGSSEGTSVAQFDLRDRATASAQKVTL